MYDNNRKTVNYDTTFFCGIVNEYTSVVSFVKNNNKEYRLARSKAKQLYWYMVVVFQVLMTQACKAEDTEIADQFYRCETQRSHERHYLILKGLKAANYKGNTFDMYIK